MKTMYSFRFPFAEYPAIRVTVLFSAGVITIMEGWLPAHVTYALLIVFLILYIFLERRSNKSINPALKSLSLVCYSFLIFFFGGVHYQLSERSTENKPEWLIENEVQKVTIQAIVYQSRMNSNGKSRADLEIRRMLGTSGWLDVQPFNARLLSDEMRFAEGDTLKALVRIIPIGEKRNPADFDYRSYLESQQIYVQFRLEELIEIRSLQESMSWLWWRSIALRAAEQLFSETTRPVAKALLLGYKNDLQYEQKQAYSRAGLSHIMAVSGLHVGFLIAPFWLLVPYARRFVPGKMAILITVSILLWIYAGITGFSASVMRASVMALFLLYGSVYHRSGDSLNLTAAAGFFLLLLDPTQILDIGFQLSFGAVYTILLVMPVVQRYLPYALRVRWYGKPVMAGIISIVVQFGLYPLQAYYFGEMSLISPLANMIFIPFLAMIIPISVLSVIIWMLSPELAHILVFCSDHFLNWMNTFVLRIPNQNWAWTSVYSPSPWIFPFWLSVLATIKSLRIPSIRWKWLAVTLCFVLLLQLNSILQIKRQKDLEVLFFDVGQGDASLVYTPNRKYILIDTGIWSPGYNSGSSVILPHLRKNGITRLDAVILSHPHSDHIGGTVDLLENIEVGIIYNSGFTYESGLYKRYLEVAEQEKVPVHPLKAGDHPDIDPAILLMVMGPDGNRYSKDPNEHSVVLRLQYGDTSFLFTGDAGEHQEERMNTQFGDLLDTDVLKVGHHGSRTSSHRPFLQAVTPEISVISLAKRNKFGHPHQEAIERLRSSGSHLYYTSEEQAVWLESNGKEISRKQWK